MDWKCVDKFLESCSNESWLSHISLLLRSSSNSNGPQSNTNTNLDVKIVEKLAVLLQKLSKIK